MGLLMRWVFLIWEVGCCYECVLVVGFEMNVVRVVCVFVFRGLR